MTDHGLLLKGMESSITLAIRVFLLLNVLGTLADIGITIRKMEVTHSHNAIQCLADGQPFPQKEKDLMFTLPKKMRILVQEQFRFE